MPFTMPNYQPLSWEQANPTLTGAEHGAKLANTMSDYITKALEQQKQSQLLPFVTPNAQQELLKAQQYNEMYKPDIQSQIGLRGAQGQQSQAAAGKLNQEATMVQPLGNSTIQLNQALAQQHKIESQQNELKLNYLREMLNNSQNTNPNPSVGNAEPGIMKPATPSNNSVYGIDTPMPSREDIKNKMLLGMDTFSPKMENAKKQQADQYNEYKKEIASSVQEANSAQKAKQILSMFNNAMDKSSFKGAFKGGFPSSGIGTGLAPFHNFANEQIADNAIANLLPGAITELREAMKTGQFSVADLNAASRMKFSRNMNDETRAQQSAWVNGIYNRFDEKSKFYTAMGNPSSGAPKSIADAAWANYQREFPLISQTGDKYQGTNLGNWPLFTTPKAIASLKATGTYKPTKSERETFMMKYPDGKTYPVKKGQVETAFRKGAKPL